MVFKKGDIVKMTESYTNELIVFYGHEPNDMEIFINKTLVVIDVYDFDYYLCEILESTDGRDVELYIEEIEIDKNYYRKLKIDKLMNVRI